MLVRLAWLIVITTWSAAALAETTADRWNLAEVYSSLAAWNADAVKLEAQLTEFAACKGHLGDSAARFRQCLDLQADLTKRYYRLGLFSGEQLAEDTGSGPSLELDQRADILGNKLKEAGAFVDPEVLHLGKERVVQFLSELQVLLLADIAEFRAMLAVVLIELSAAAKARPARQCDPRDQQ